MNMEGPQKDVQKEASPEPPGIGSSDRGHEIRLLENIKAFKPNCSGGGLGWGWGFQTVPHRDRPEEGGKPAKKIDGPEEDAWRKEVIL